MLSARSFAISLAIVIAVTQTPVCGFTIRGRDTTDTITDLVAEGSSLLEVKYDVGKTDTKMTDSKRDKTEMDSTVIAINRLSPNIQVNKETNNSNELDIDSKIATPTKLIPREHTDNMKDDLIMENSSSLNEKTTFPAKMIFENVSISNQLTSPLPATKVATEKVVSTKEDGFLLVPSNLTLKPTSTINTDNENMSHTKTSNTPLTPNIIDGFKLALNETNTENFTTLETTTDTVSKEYTSAELSTIDYSEQAENQTISDRSTEPQSSLKVVSLLPVTTETTSVINETESTTKASTNSVTNAILVDTTYSEIIELTTTKPWKKYSTMDRKRESEQPISTNKSTVTMMTTQLTSTHVPEKENMVKSETAQTGMTLENLIQMTPIPSFEDLRLRLMSMNEVQKSTVKADTFEASKGYLSTSTKLKSAKPIQLMAIKGSSKLDVVSSKRGGYLDNTESTTSRSLEATTPQLEIRNISYTEMFGPLETEPSEGNAFKHKNATGAESQSQLVDDAIKEELLREETLNDNEVNAKRYNDEGVKSLGDKRNKPDSQPNDVVGSDDALSVKPIPSDKKINASLYAVSPNYKPLKKIDVQPPKQFVRDPDDNSWRNESISSLGIVFKPKNSSKSFTQVLKNKTETELNNTTEKDNKGEMPDLRIRLEKIAEVRKSKKKKTNKLGEVVYTDYDSGELTNAPVNDTTSPATSFLDSILSIATPETPSESQNTTKKEKIDIFNMKDPSLLTTNKPKKYFNIAEYYDNTDEYDADYLKVTKMDLKKFTKPSIKTTLETTTRVPQAVYTTQLSNYVSDRRPTVQYFPPTKKVTPKITVDDYDLDFQRKINLYAYKDAPKKASPESLGSISSTLPETEAIRITPKPESTPDYKPADMGKPSYLTQQSHVTDPQDGYAANDGNFDRASYVIKHYKDFINEAARDSDEDRSIDYLPFTESPMRGVTIDELAKLTEKDAKPTDDDYEYEVQFRKDLMSRFIDNFNQNSERFKVDFPILYNSSVVHRKIPDNGKVLAASTAYLKRQYEGARPCGANCDKLAVELSPDYELHYFVPEQEEKEVFEQRQVTVPYRYRNTHL